MDRWTEREDGLTGWEDGMNRTDGNQMDAKAIGQRDRMEDGQTGGEHGLTQTAGKNEEGDGEKKFSFFSYHFFLLLGFLQFHIHFSHTLSTPQFDTTLLLFFFFSIFRYLFIIF